MSTAIKIENVSKQYRLGVISTGTLSHDLNRWWTTKILRKEDPYLKVGETNDRATKGSSEYVWALKDINMEIEQGDVVGIIGKNGAGKSTLLKLLSRVTKPTTGSIKYKGRIASLLEVGTGFHPEMTGRENIYMNGAIMGMTRQEITRKLDEIVDFSGCERYIDTPVKRYSSGMTVRLGFAIAAHLDPEILVVDEVLAVGDAEFQKKAIGKMQDVSKGEGRTVLFVSHNMAAVRNLCKKGALLENGTIKNVGNVNKIVDEYLKDQISVMDDVSVVEMFKRNLGKEDSKFIKREVEFVKVERKMSYAIDAVSDLLFSVRIKRNEQIPAFNMTVMISDVATKNRVGMAYAFDIKWYNDNCSILDYDIKIPNHHLSKGQYYFDIWLHSGSLFSKYKYYDAVYETITFEIERINNNYINEWYSYWGKICCPLIVNVNNNI